jgi:chromosome segregation ATPase
MLKVSLKVKLIEKEEIENFHKGQLRQLENKVTSLRKDIFDIEKNCKENEEKLEEDLKMCNILNTNIAKKLNESNNNVRILQDKLESLEKIQIELNDNKEQNFFAINDLKSELETINEKLNLDHDDFNLRESSLKKQLYSKDQNLKQCIQKCKSMEAEIFVYKQKLKNEEKNLLTSWAIEKKFEARKYCSATTIEHSNFFDGDSQLENLNRKLESTLDECTRLKHEIISKNAENCDLESKSEYLGSENSFLNKKIAL